MSDVVHIVFSERLARMIFDAVVQHKTREIDTVNLVIVDAETQTSSLITLLGRQMTF